MMKYDIDWYLSFKNKASTSFICNLVNTLGLTPEHCIRYDNADLTYRIHGSLDICMPIILTKCVGHKIDIFRDCSVDKFVILISD